MIFFMHTLGGGIDFTPLKLVLINFKGRFYSEKIIISFSHIAFAFSFHLSFRSR